MLGVYVLPHRLRNADGVGILDLWSNFHVIELEAAIFSYKYVVELKVYSKM
jgi:hypothetical protein